VRDIRTMARLLSDIGAEVREEPGSYLIRTAEITSPEAPYELVKTMRASSLVLGPLVARTGRARVSLPGGCAIGARPINLHIHGLEKLGARIRQRHGYVEAQAPKGLKGALVRFDRITVTGTEDLMMAAGETVLEMPPASRKSGSRRPAVPARARGARNFDHPHQGVSQLHGAAHDYRIH
jgi:UDP-N-acetylglucosamine 1-carboxyvinyltransferase